MLLFFVNWCNITVTGLANFGFTPLLRWPQCPQGCLEEQSYPLSSNFVVWCAKIGLKTKEVLKTSQMTRKISKNDVFFDISHSGKYVFLNRSLDHICQISHVQRARKLVTRGNHICQLNWTFNLIEILNPLWYILCYSVCYRWRWMCWRTGQSKSHWSFWTIF